MSTPPNHPDDKPASTDRNADGEPKKRGGALLWLLLLVALLLLGWWWFSQRGIMDGTPQPPPADTAIGEPIADAAIAEKTAAEEARRKSTATKDKPRKSDKPATPRLTEARPLTRRNPQPEYPREAQRRGQSGRVLLRVDVAADGSTTNVDFAQRSGSAELDRAAMNAVRKWQFTPARRNGKPVASSVNVPVDFVLPPG